MNLLRIAFRLQVAAIVLQCLTIVFWVLTILKRSH
jgi:hypothetical protein